MGNLIFQLLGLLSVGLSGLFMAVPIQQRYTLCQYAFHFGRVEGALDGWGSSKLPQLPEMEKALVCLSGRGLDVEWKVI